MTSSISAYGSLFLIALASATVIPSQSEGALAALLIMKTYPVPFLLLAASVGNILGSVINWFLGRYIETFRHRKWFPFKKKAIDKAERFYARYGKWTLLLSWVPVIGDPLTMIGGMMRVPLHIFLAIVAPAKICRYLAVIWIVQEGMK